MYETLVALLAAHLLSDFVLQTDWMATNKKTWWVLAIHVLIVGACAAAALAPLTRAGALAILIIAVTHLAIDFLKTRSADTVTAFLADQAAHIGVVGAIAIMAPFLAAQGAWASLPGDQQAQYYAALAYGAGFIAAVALGGILIRKVITPFVPVATGTGASAAAPAAPANAGRYIGWLERALTFGFILAKMPEGVGFLLAAKSVLRIGDLKDHDQRSHAEYIIIGTFLSFGWALLITLMTGTVARHWTSS